MYQNIAKTFPKRDPEKFMLSYCLFLCDSLREVRDRSNKRKPWIPSSATLLLSISDHNSSLICSSAWWLSPSYSTFSMKPGSNSLKWEGPTSQSICVAQITDQPKLVPVWHLWSLPGTVSCLCWWLIWGSTLQQRSHHFPCAYPTLTPGVILETSAWLTESFSD